MIQLLMISLDTTFCLVLAAFTNWNLSSIYSFTLFFLGKLHVHVGLVVDGEDGGGSKLLVNFVLDTSFTSFA
jgi:hypothetical protein